jgi:hypothetical protein
MGTQLLLECVHALLAKEANDLTPR